MRNVGSVFSVIIPLFNKEKSVLNTLESILRQTFDSYEVIIVDDGSSDQSAAIVTHFIERNGLAKNWHLYKKLNGGVSSARNYGVSKSSFDYIAFLDADDEWEPGYLFHQQKMIQNFPDASLWGCSWGYSENGARIRINHNPNNYLGYIDDYWSIKKGTNIFHVGSSIYRKSALLQIGGYDERISMGEDLDVTYRMLLTYRAAYNSQYSGFYYVQDAENRAMNITHPIKKTLAAYIDKYSEQKRQNIPFAKHIDALALAILKPYILEHRETEEVARILTMINLRDQKLINKFLVKCPWGYKILTTIYQSIKK